MSVYRHQQTAQWIVLLLAVPAVAIAIGGFMSGMYGTLAVAAFLIVMAIAFSMLVTQVDERAVSWWYTLSVPSWSVPLSDIAKAEVTTTSFWLEGYGVHWTIWHGWLWNVSGYGAVMLTTKAGNRITIGTNDPQGLFEAIERFRSGD
jgi:hypothetical protein